MIYNIMAAFDYTAFSGMVTDLVGDLVTPAIAILGGVLALAGGVLLVRVGFRFIKGFVK